MAAHSLIDFEKELTGGHPNSLGNTLTVVKTVLNSPKLIDNLFLCYDSDDAVVRLRTSNAFKRIFREHPECFKPWVKKFFLKIPKLKQPSAEWTLAQICLECEKVLSKAQKAKATEIIKTFLTNSQDWIVLNMSMETLGTWAKSDTALKKWLLPKLSKLSKDPRKSVAKKAKTKMDLLK